MTLRHQGFQWGAPGHRKTEGAEVNAPVQRRAAQRTVRCNRLLGDQRTGFGGGLWELNPQKLVD
jgi:hypothetical protein